MGRGFIQNSMAMTIEADREEVLNTLRKNRETHAQIVAEARKGYVTSALAALVKKIEALKAGKITSLAFQLSPPLEYTEAYDTAIRMLELHQAKTIQLSATEVRCLVMDEWDWSSQFLTCNSAYSSAAAEYAMSKGIKIDD